MASWTSCPAKSPFGSPSGVHGKRKRRCENGAKNSIPNEYVDSASRQPWDSSARPETRARRVRCRAHCGPRKKMSVAAAAPTTANASECVIARCATGHPK